MSTTQIKSRYWLTFDLKTGSQPLIYKMSRQYDIVFNIRQATMSSTLCLMALEFEGEHELIEKVVAWFKEQGVQVDPIEINTIEG